MQTVFDLFLKNYPDSTQLIEKQLREIILSELPGMMELVDAPSKIVAYSTSTKYADLVCALAPYLKYVNLMFSRGASMPNPDGILSGTGKKARHIRVEKLTDEMGEKIRKYLHTAVEVNN